MSAPVVEPAGDRRFSRMSARSGDIRSSRPHLLWRRPTAALVRRFASIVSLVAVDVCGLALGLYAALALREVYYGNTPLLWGLLWEAEKAWLPFVTLVTVLVFWRADLYAARESRARSGAVLSSLVIVGVLTFAFAVGIGRDFSTYGLIPTAVVLSAVLIGLLRMSYEQVSGYVLNLSGARRRVLLVGHGEELEHLRQTLGSTDRIKYEFVGTLSHEEGALGRERVGLVSELARALDACRVDEIVVADSGLTERALLDLADAGHRAGVRVRVASTSREILAQRARYVPGQGVPLFELRAPVLAGTDWLLKRCLDLSVSALALLVGLPLWLLIAAAIKITSSGPVLYVDQRVGVNEREFPMLKFRTMYVGTQVGQADLEDANDAEGALFKLRSDPRVTPIGAILRRFSLDEFPQLVNVLRGEMSLVGPRPLPLRDYRRLEPWHRKRYLVLPGVTGLWQISGRSNLSFDEFVRLDFYYVENWSIWLDISVILRTIPAVIAGRGAY
jgi:exopolysaccharide biosynthesis polyprenyl glycosylphosphotransferase